MLFSSDYVTNDSCGGVDEIWPPLEKIQILCLSVCLANHHRQHTTNVATAPTNTDPLHTATPRATVVPLASAPHAVSDSISTFGLNFSYFSTFWLKFSQFSHQLELD